jgi:hypothetical protein
VSQHFNSVSVGPVLNQPDSSDFAWRTKNLLWGELNIRKTELYVKHMGIGKLTNWLSHTENLTKHSLNLKKSLVNE